MPGLPDYEAQRLLNDATGCIPLTSTSTSRFLALFTTPPTGDNLSGGTEVSGGAYARIQVAGQLAASASWTTSSTTLTLASTAPAWLLALGTNGSGVNVYDNTNGQQIGTVSSISGTTVTLTSTAAHASSGSTDNLQFSAWPQATASSGSEPATTAATVTNGASITGAQATANWGNVEAWVLFDASSSGNGYFWDYMGNYPWQPISVTSASPAVHTGHAHGYSANDNVVVSAKAGGTVPTASAGSYTGALTVLSAGLTTDAFELENGATTINTSTSGDLMVRKITGTGGTPGQPININVTPSFAASSFTLNAA